SRVDDAVDPPPLGGERLPQRMEVGSVGDDELQHLRDGIQALGAALGQRQTTAEAGEDHLGTLLLRQLCDQERNRLGRQHTGDEDLLSLEKHGLSSDSIRLNQVWVWAVLLESAAEVQVVFR